MSLLNCSVNSVKHDCQHPEQKLLSDGSGLNVHASLFTECPEQPSGLSNKTAERAGDTSSSSPAAGSKFSLAS